RRLDLFPARLDAGDRGGLPHQHSDGSPVVRQDYGDRTPGFGKVTVNARILVTPRSLTAERHPYVEELRARGYDVVYCTPGATPSEEELLALAPGCVGWLAGVE